MLSEASPRHCERSEAIHLAAEGNVDCFVASLLAMTTIRPNFYWLHFEPGARRANQQIHVHPWLKKYSTFVLAKINSTTPLVSPDERGGSRVVTNVRWDAVDAKVATDERGSSGRRSRVVLAPDAGLSFAEMICEVTVAKELGSPGRARYKP
jgi:hypothetical protein